LDERNPLESGKDRKRIELEAKEGGVVERMFNIIPTAVINSLPTGICEEGNLMWPLKFKSHKLDQD
jgi:hypothetical protein